MTKKYAISLNFFWLGLLFVGLKLANVITWSWLWVTSPFWIGAIISICAFIFMGLFMLFLAWLIKKGVPLKVTIKEKDNG